MLKRETEGEDVRKEATDGCIVNLEPLKLGHRRWFEWQNVATLREERIIAIDLLDSFEERLLQPKDIEIRSESSVTHRVIVEWIVSPDWSRLSAQVLEVVLVGTSWVEWAFVERGFVGLLGQHCVRDCVRCSSVSDGEQDEDGRV